MYTIHAKAEDGRRRRRRIDREMLTISCHN